MKTRKGANHQGVASHGSSGDGSSSLRHERPVLIVMLAIWVLWSSTAVATPAWAGEPSTALDTPVARTAQSTVPAENLQGCGGAQMASSNPEFEAEVVRLINQIRLDNGLMPLKRVSTLDDASRFHATDMSVDNYFSHTSHDRVNGQLVESCQWADRLAVYYTGWASIAENIAAGYATPQAVVDAWMNSEGHRRNILADTNWEIGVGYYSGAGSYLHYWVQDFGQRRDVYPVVIDGEASTTETGNVTLHLYGDWQEVRLRTDDDAWSEWQPFAPVVGWSIQGATGEHTVTVEMRNGNRTVQSQDTIVLTQSNQPAAFPDLPNNITFYYDIATGNLAPDQHALRPLQDDMAPGYFWQASVNGNWINLSRSNGGIADSLEIRPVIGSADAVAESAGTVTLNLYDSTNTLVDSHSLQVSLDVVDQLHNLYVPVATK